MIDLRMQSHFLSFF